MTKATTRSRKRRNHNHDTVFYPKTGKLYHPGCPSCDKNAKFIRAITKEGITNEEWRDAVEEYLSE